MRVLPCLFLFTAAIVAGQEYTRYATDVNGTRVLDSQSLVVKAPGDVARTERVQSANGRMVPFEQTEERVVKDGPDGKVVERIVKRFDAEGRPSQTEKTVIEQSNDGSRLKTSTYRSDINGRMELAERTSAEIVKSGSTTTSNTLVERPTLNGGLQTVERRESVVNQSGTTKQENLVIQRRDPNGSFVEAVREVREQQKLNGKTVDNTAIYEPGLSGQLQLSRQAVATTTELPGGRTVTELNLFRPSMPGQSPDITGRQQLYEQQMIERKASNSGFVETLSVRRPSLSDPTRLGPAQQLYETVCKGKCNPDPNAKQN
jgi:hypothetical protein